MHREAARPGRKSDVQVMLEIRDLWMSLAAKEMQEAKEQGRPLNIALLAEATNIAGTFASKRAPYFHSRLSVLTIREEILDLTKLTDNELDTLAQLRLKATVAGSDQGRESPTQH